jgi:hypothetical protein
MFPRFELPAIDDDPVLFDGPPEWLVPGLRSAMREAEPDGLGLRSLIERVQVPPRPWRTSPPGRQARCTGRRRPGRVAARFQPILATRNHQPHCPRRRAVAAPHKGGLHVPS